MGTGRCLRRSEEVTRILPTPFSAALVYVGGRVPAGLGELITGKGATAQLCCEFVASAVPLGPSLPVPFPGPGFIVQARKSL